MTTVNPTSLSARCDARIAEYDLLAHPFYVAWSEGTLPAEALRDYARDYGAFIQTIGQGWAAVGEAAIARIEEAHALVWSHSFAGPLGVTVAEPEGGPVSDLVATARALFAERGTALGALYAFEAQQPRTARSSSRGWKRITPTCPPPWAPTSACTRTTTPSRRSWPRRSTPWNRARSTQPRRPARR